MAMRSLQGGLWNVGNEMFRSVATGLHGSRQYAIKHNMVVQAMRRVDPSIEIVASGATPVEASQSRAALISRETRDWIRRAGGLHRRAFGQLRGVLDAIAEHIMPSTVDRAFDGGKAGLRESGRALVNQARKLANGVRARRSRLGTNTSGDTPLSRWIRSDGARMNGSPAGSATLEIPCSSPLACAQALQEMFRHSNRLALGVHRAPELLAITMTDVTVRPSD